MTYPRDSLAIMSPIDPPVAYATTVQVGEYLAGTVHADMLPDDPAAVTRLIDLAERDIDAIAFVTLPRRAGAHKIDPAALDAGQAEALASAIAAQVAYRLEMGPEFFVRAQRERVQTRNVSHVGRLPTLGPQTSRELTGGALWHLTSSSHGRANDRWQAE